MDITKLLKKTLINFLETLDKEVRLSICIDKIYYDQVVNEDGFSRKIYNIINDTYEDDELEENSTIVINKSGGNFSNIQRVFRFVEDCEKIKDKGKVNKAIKKFRNIFVVNHDNYGARSYSSKIKKISDIKVIIQEFKEIFK